MVDIDCHTVVGVIAIFEISSFFLLSCAHIFTRCQSVGVEYVFLATTAPIQPSIRALSLLLHGCSRVYGPQYLLPFLTHIRCFTASIARLACLHHHVLGCFAA